MINLDPYEKISFSCPSSFLCNLLSSITSNYHNSTSRKAIYLLKRQVSAMDL